MTILLIEDDPTLSRNISEALISENMHVETAFDGMIAERMLQQYAYNCVIMDINLPGKNGFELCSEFRHFNRETPVLMLTAFGELEDKVKGYNCGADDYLTKPFYLRELLLRVQSLIKRSTNKQAGITDDKLLVAGDITISRTRKKVHRKGVEVPLTPREYQVLLLLVENNGEIVAKQDFIKEIWGSRFDANTNTIEVYVNFLRNKIDKPFGKTSIKTKVGYGYYLDTA